MIKNLPLVEMYCKKNSEQNNFYLGFSKVGRINFVGNTAVKACLDMAALVKGRRTMFTLVNGRKLSCPIQSSQRTASKRTEKGVTARLRRDASLES